VFATATVLPARQIPTSVAEPRGDGAGGPRDARSVTSLVSLGLLARLRVSVGLTYVGIWPAGRTVGGSRREKAAWTCGRLLRRQGRRPTVRRKSGGAILSRASSGHRVRVATNQLERFEPWNGSASRQLLGARPAAGYERGPISRPQPPQQRPACPRRRYVRGQPTAIPWAGGSAAKVWGSFLLPPEGGSYAD
jgi:hypothetical protein